MGWETAAAALFTLHSAGNKISNAESEGKAIIREGEQVASNIADDTVRNIGKLKTSFVNSGIVLDDIGGTLAVFKGAAEKGRTDISRTIENANNKAKNVYSAARTAALESIGKMAIGSIGSFGSSSFGSTLTENTGYALNNMGFGNTAYSLLENNDYDPSPGAWWE